MLLKGRTPTAPKLIAHHSMETTSPSPIKIIGAGLAGCEAAWQCARRGVPVVLYEIRPVKMTPAHQTSDFGELVCSNSLKSESENTAPWLLKQEMRRASSLLLKCADESAVPAGHALAVDRAAFSKGIMDAIAAEPLIEVRREEVTAINEDKITVVASGPLTSDALSQDIARLSGDTHLYCYESISPVVDAESIDLSKVYFPVRYWPPEILVIACATWSRVGMLPLLVSIASAMAWIRICAQS